MTIKVTVNETQLEYHPLSGFGRWLRGLIATIPPNPPYRYKRLLMRLMHALKFDRIGKEIRVEPEIIETYLKAHATRLRTYDRLSTNIYYGLAFVIFIPIYIYFNYLGNQVNSILLSLLLRSTSFLFQLVVGGFAALLSIKIVGVLLDKRYADSLVMLSSLYLIIDLNQPDELINPEFKRRILERIHILRKNIILLSQTFTDVNSGGNQEAIARLKDIEGYISEREGWVITPKKNTLGLLRKDFDKLAMLLISGQYGEFKSKVKSKKVETVSVPLTFTDKVLHLIFFLFPYILLLILYFKPEYIVNLGLNITTVFLVCIAWILITIDARLKLGFVERVTGLAKTMKELG